MAQILQFFLVFSSPDFQPVRFPAKKLPQEKSKTNINVSVDAPGVPRSERGYCGFKIMYIKRQ